MLRFESRGKSISLTLRDKERLVSHSFLVALAIALSLHLLGALLFHIQPFRIAHERRHYLPAVVDADLSVSEPLIIADLLSPEKKRSYLLKPPTSEPRLPSLPEASPYSPFEEKKVFLSNSNPFLLLEREGEVPGPVDSFFDPPPSALISVSGPLASLGFSYKKPTSIASSSKDYYLARYRVQVQQGAIFFIESIESEGEKGLKKQADAAFESLTFDSNDRMIKGIVEVMITS